MRAIPLVVGSAPEGLTRRLPGLGARLCHKAWNGRPVPQSTLAPRGVARACFLAHTAIIGAAITNETESSAMHESGEVEIEAEAIADFQADGVCVVRGLFTDWVETLRAGVERNLTEPGPYVRRYTPEGQPGFFFGDYCNWQRIPEYRQFVEQSNLGEIAAILMGAAEVRFFHEHVLVKEPHTQEPTPWHHDHPYYSVDCDQSASFWIPLDEVSASVCPEFIKGSHRWGKWYVPTRFTGQNWDRKQEQESDLEFIPDIDARRDEYDIVSYDLTPGDAVVFDFLTVHGAPPNLSGTRRRAFSARVLGDNARWAVRSGTTSPPFPELSERMQAGDSLDGLAEFPVLRA